MKGKFFYFELSSDDDDADDILPDELPKQNFIKNGLRSNYYKTVDSKTLRFVF